MKVSTAWMEATGAEYRAEASRIGYADLQHYTAAYAEWGEGPPLVLIPGLAGGYELLGPIARLLARTHRVVSYQLRGEEDCFALRRRFGLKDLADDLDEFLDYHRLEAPILMGVSFGGVLALQYAARNSYRISQLIVQGCGARFEEGLLQEVAGTVLSRYPLPTDNPFVNQFFNLLFGKRQRPGPLFQFVTQQCWRTDQSVMAHRFRLAQHFDLTGELSRISVPTLSLVGDRDLLVSPASREELWRGVADCHQVLLKGCGHLAFATDPERVAGAVADFLAGVEVHG